MPMLGLRRLLILLFLLITFLPSASAEYVIINEFYPDTYVDYDRDEYVSIYNPMNNTAGISNWTISDGEGEFIFPHGTILPPSQSFYIARNESPLRLSNKGDEIFLYDENGKEIDVVVYGSSDYTGEGWDGEPIASPREGIVFARCSSNDTNTKSDWTSYRFGQSHFPPTRFKFHGNVTVFVSPDSSFDVLAGVIEDAQSSLYLCLYDFTNYYLMEHVVNATRRGVDVRILLEGNPVGGVENDTLFIAKGIEDAGGDVRFMIGNGQHRRYRFVHAKYALIDDGKTVITTENWGYTGIPVENTFGNRGWGVVIEDTNTTGYFLDVFEEDWRGEDICKKDVEDLKKNSAKKKIDQNGDYKPVFESMRIEGDFTIIPVIAPDNALMNETIIGLINCAEESVYIEQNCIQSEWRDGPNLYLESAIDAARRGCEVRILLDRSWYNVNENEKTISYVNEIADEDGLNLEAEFVTDIGLEKLHTKGLVVDRQAALISSINWNENSPHNNREAGVIIINPAVAEYYTDVFLYDRESERSLLPAAIIVLMIFLVGLFMIKRYLR
jgi:phosphatidylserine/phosphatidylglycerophosphate/cardiolipin synthase-like enzyme